MAEHSVGNNPIDPVGPDEPQHVDNPEGAHEEIDVNPKTLFIFLGVLVAVIAVVMILMWLMFDAFEYRTAAADPEKPPLAGQREEYTGVKLESNSTKDIDAMRKQQKKLMTTYGRVKGEDRFVRVPVAVAMEAIAKNGLPDWSSEEDAPGGDSPAEEPPAKQNDSEIESGDSESTENESNEAAPAPPAAGGAE